MTRDEVLAAFDALPPYRRLQALRIACDDALAVWRQYRLDGAPLEYRDSIVGELHTVDDTLPARALADVDAMLAGAFADPAIAYAYLEPIAAIQDDDLDLPDPVEMAYHAIYNLRALVARDTAPSIGGKRIVLAADERIVLAQIGHALPALDGHTIATPPDETKLDAWAEEWWTRAWDAWASAPDPAYPPARLSEAAFEALAAGDLGALAIIDDPMLRAIILALSGDRDDAVSAAAAALGIELTAEIRPWLAIHLFELCPDAIAVDRVRSRYFVIRGERCAVWNLATGSGESLATIAGSTYRLLRFIHDTIWTAGERSDAQGVTSTFIEGRAQDKYFQSEIVGRRTLAALSPGTIVSAHPDRVLLSSEVHRELLGELPVVAAVVSGDSSIVVTHDDVRVSIWHRDPPSCARIAMAGKTPRRIAVGGGELLIVWSDGSSQLTTLASG